MEQGAFQFIKCKFNFEVQIKNKFQSIAGSTLVFSTVFRVLDYWNRGYVLGLVLHYMFLENARFRSRGRIFILISPGLGGMTRGIFAGLLTSSLQ